MTQGRATRRDGMVPLLVLISATTGLVDAVSVLGLGRVFTANMTGNIVFLGFAVAGAPGFSWHYCTAALLAFLAGAAAGGRLFRAIGQRRRKWLLVVASVEAALLAGAATTGLVAGRSEASLIAMIGLTGAAMGLRNATVRQLKIPDLTTTVLTVTITGVAADSRWAGGDGPNLGRRFLSISAIMVGAFAGALLVLAVGTALPLLVAAAGTLIPTIALARDVPAEAG
ncbi:MAG: DUF1275 domain-containing protein [Alphaproteobacteria bacterium]|nr:DUF1275 domain-containing protein [Alphaproteobacteria bacterium]MBV9372282.1 DUF1275 domain-containing protein [Alphaproteobacteria bacterium]MBV9899574.1 DUF1275 domain-containing protein [Alphaproteobacteria bacterium]